MAIRSRAALFVMATAVLASCAITPPPTPTGFVVDYQTGSIPPPFNYAYTLTGSFEGADVVVRYDLTYQFREEMTAEELEAQGYSPDDDIHWDGRLSGQQAGAWRSLASTATIGPIPPQLPGSDSFNVRISFADGRQLSGLPEDRAEWQALIDAVDQQARAETGNPRPSR